MLGSEQETINFYIRLGYSDVIVREAYRYAKDTKIDIFDAIQQITKWSSEDKNTIHKQYRSSKSY